MPVRLHGKIETEKIVNMPVPQQEIIFLICDFNLHRRQTENDGYPPCYTANLTGVQYKLPFLFPPSISSAVLFVNTYLYVFYLH